MPFTLSHPLFAAPLRKAIPSLSLTGLIVGSMGPDFEYFIAMVPIRTVGHTMEGFLLQVLPLGIAFSFAFHRCVKPLIPLLLPNIGGLKQYAAQLIQPWRLSTGGDWLLFILSLFIGFLTHLFMDHWTHASGWFVKAFPVLQSIMLGDYVYHLLQLGFSVLGAVIPFLYGWYHWHKWRSNRVAIRMPHNNSWQIEQNSNSGIGVRLWLLIVMSSAALFAGKLVVSSDPISLGVLIVAPITSAAFGLLIAGLAYASTSRQTRGKFLLASATIIGVVVVFQIMQRTSFDWLMSWLVYHWLLSAAIAAGTIAVTTRRKISSFSDPAE